MKDYTYLYSTRIQKTFDEDQADILNIVRTELSKNAYHEVQLINYYKGMPVSFKARIVGIDKDALDLDVSSEQAVAMSTERYTFIRSRLFAYAVLARVQYVNVKRKAVSLRKLCYVEIMAETRKHIRLELDPPINASFNAAAGIVRGKLIELSIVGTVMSIAKPFDVALDEQVVLTAMVPDIEQSTTYNIKLPSVVAEVSDAGAPRHIRLSINTDDRISDRVLAKYLYHRQVEIIRELKETAQLGMVKFPDVSSV